jgi:ATP-dependent Clp protease ATP-binding subunit ClpB
MKDVLLNKDRLIIFIDEIHTLLDAGSAEGAIGARDILKPVLSKGEFPCIGATTYDGAQYFSRDATLSRRFKKVVIKEPSKREAMAILRGVSDSFGRHHGVIIDDEALIAAVNYSSKYMTDGYLPGKAISLLDGAAAYCSVHGVKRVKKRDILIELERIQDG